MMLITVVYALKSFEKEDLMYWVMESWFFVKQIVPLLLIGVFIVGVAGEILKATDIVGIYLGGEIRQNFIAAIIGASFKCPALALLFAGTGLSLPNMLAIGRFLGFRKAVVYIATIVVLSTIAGIIYGKAVEVVA